MPAAITDVPVGEVFGSLRVLGDAGWREYPAGGRHFMLVVECVRCGDQTVKPSFRVRHQSLKYGCSKCAYSASRGTGSAHWKGGEYVPAYFVAKIKKGCDRRSREIPFTVSFEYLDALWLAQGGRCALTGWGLCFGDNATEQTASLDRIDSALGYVEGNVQFVHKDVNIAKWSQSQGDFIDMCKAVTANAEKDVEK